MEKPEEYQKSVEIGKDGSIIQSTEGAGLLLPQVATEFNFTPLQFLECLCEKAGLQKNSWKNQNIKIYKFHAEIFSE